MPDPAQLPEPIEIDCRGRSLDELRGLEWLTTNKLGSYASSSVVGSNTRRYHGLLVAATMPPVGRCVVLSLLLEQVVVGRKVIDLSTFQFPGAFSPPGYVHLVRFVNDVAPTWHYEVDGLRITKQLTLAEQSNTLAVRYKVEGQSGQDVAFRVWPFMALRDFHSLRRVSDPHQILYVAEGCAVQVEDRGRPGPAAYVRCSGGRFEARPQWWYRFQYGVDIDRGQEGLEDLYTPGFFQFAAAPGQWSQLTAACEKTGPIDFDSSVARRRGRLEALVSACGNGADDTTRQLAVATDVFLATRDTPAGPSATVLAGYHWFADWGRDSFIALPGLTLLTGQYDKALQVLRTFAAAVKDGMIPNRFDDYGRSPHYNSIDASLWFVQAVDRYLRASGDEEAWRRDFMGVVQQIARSYQEGTNFHIHADADGLIFGGSVDTQLTWMDVKFNEQAITPRQGKAVEVNALYLEALHVLADRCRGIDDEAADRYAAESHRVGASFARAFWYDQGGYLYDCLGPEGPDASMRPNQIIAVAQPHCPLSPAQQRSVIQKAVEHLLTPYGLRTLSPSDGRYRGQYGGSWESRDRAYHQGTAWAWLMGPLVQAHLKVNEFSTAARKQAAGWLDGFDRHLHEVGLGTISEVFDGNAPYTPGGCIAQAWSVAEVLRAKRMIQLGCLL